MELTRYALAGNEALARQLLRQECGRCRRHIVYRRRGLAPTVVPPISLILATCSDDYINGLIEYRVGDAAEWALLFAIVTIASVCKARGLGDRIEQLRVTWLAELDNPRADASVRRVVERLPAVFDLLDAFERELATPEGDRSRRDRCRAVPGGRAAEPWAR